MTTRQKWLWRDVLRRAPRGVLQACDREALTLYVLHADVCRQAASELRSQPLLDAEGRPTALLRPITQHGEAMAHIGSRLGFDPQARTALALPKEPPKPSTDPAWQRLRRFPTVAGGRS